MAALYAEDAQSMPFMGPELHGRAALRNDFNTFFSENDSAVHTTFVDSIIMRNDLAIERAHYRLTYKPHNASTQIETGRHIECRKKVDGKWLIFWEIWNTDPPKK
jgi:uncharacterized protein (TIGR02246 family)